MVFAKGCEFLLVFLGEGFGAGFRWVAAVVFLWGNEEKGVNGVGRVGGEVGTGKEPASQCARVCQNYP